MRSIVVVAVLLALAGAGARAEERDAKKRYPSSLVERPMILPPLMFQPTFEFNLSNRNQSGTTNGGVGESIGFGMDLGVVRGLQLGFFFAFPLHPVADFGDFVFNLQGGLGRAANFRLDLGAERIAGNSGHADSFIF